MSPDDRRGIDAFIDAYWQDVDQGRVRLLRDYLTVFPDDEIAIAAEYVRLQEPRASRGKSEIGLLLSPSHRHGYEHEQEHEHRRRVHRDDDGHARRLDLLRRLHVVVAAIEREWTADAISDAISDAKTKSEDAAP